MDFECVLRLAHQCPAGTVWPRHPQPTDTTCVDHQMTGHMLSHTYQPQAVASAGDSDIMDGTASDDECAEDLLMPICEFAEAEYQQRSPNSSQLVVGDHARVVRVH